MWSALIVGGAVGWGLAQLPREALWEWLTSEAAPAARTAADRARLAIVVSAILGAYMVFIAAPLVWAALSERATHDRRALAQARLAAVARVAMAGGDSDAAAAAAAVATPLTDVEAFPGSTFLGHLQRRGSLGFLEFLQPVLRLSLLERALRSVIAAQEAAAAGRGGRGRGSAAATPSPASPRARAGASAGAGAIGRRGDEADDDDDFSAALSGRGSSPLRERRMITGLSSSASGVGTSGSTTLQSPALPVLEFSPPR